MSSEKITSLPIFYFRGLNTRGDDFLHLYPQLKTKLGIQLRTNFGLLNKNYRNKKTTMYQEIEKEFSKYPIQFTSIKNMKTGSIEEVTNFAKASILQDPLWQQSDQVCFLGHSTGGLIARALAHDKDIKPKVKKIISFGTPNLGTNVADRTLLIPEVNPIIHKLLQLTGFDLERRCSPVKHLTKESVKEFNKIFSNLNEIEYLSILCHSPYKQLGPLMKVLAQIAHRETNPKSPNKWINKPSDGLIFREHQIYGKIIAEFNLDHISEIGFYPLMKKRQKIRHQNEFKKMIKLIVDSVRK